MYHFIIPCNIIFTALFKVPQAIWLAVTANMDIYFFFHWWIAVKCKIKFCILSKLILRCFHNEYMV